MISSDKIDIDGVHADGDASVFRGSGRDAWLQRRHGRERRRAIAIGSRKCVRCWLLARRSDAGCITSGGGECLAKHQCDRGPSRPARPKQRRQRRPLVCPVRRAAPRCRSRFRCDRRCAGHQGLHVRNLKKPNPHPPDRRAKRSRQREGSPEASPTAPSTPVMPDRDAEIPQGSDWTASAISATWQPSGGGHRRASLDLRPAENVREVERRETKAALTKRQIAVAVDSARQTGRSAARAPDDRPVCGSEPNQAARRRQVRSIPSGRVMAASDPRNEKAKTPQPTPRREIENV